MSKGPTYLHFRPNAGWSARGAITPFASEHFKLDAYRWRQLSSLTLPQVGSIFRPLVNFKPFRRAREMRGRG